MKRLVDAHVWLWMQPEPGRLQASTLAHIADTTNVVLLSSVSAWEIAIKFALGRLPLPMVPAEYVRARMAASGTTALPIAHRHELHVAGVPDRHRDPLDRLPVAQAQLEGATLVTADRILERHDVALMWA